MKKTVGAIFAVLLLGIFTVVSVSAEDDANVLVISQNESGQLVCTTDDGVETVAQNLNSLFRKVSVYDGAEVIFKGVSLTDESVLPTGSYTVKGALRTNGADLTVPEGADVLFSNFTLEFELSAEFFVSGIALFENSKIIAENSRAIVAASDRAKIILKKCTVTNNSTKYPTLDITRGELVSVDCLIENASGVCINNSSSLTLSGSTKLSGIGVDILTEKAITLESEGKYFDGDLTVKYLDYFENGKSTAVFEKLKEETVKYITLYDVKGAEYDLTFFSSTNGNTAEVYLPFEVKLRDKRAGTKTRYVLYGESIELPDGEEYEGYIFDGWFLDEEGKTRLNGEYKVTADTEIFARYSLTPPVFSVSSLEFVYDGAARSLGIASIAHPLGESGFFIYEWFKDGNFISSSEELKLCEVKDSGIYSCKITFFVNADSVSVVADNIEVSIGKMKLPSPKLTKKVYTSAPLLPDIKDSLYYVHECDSYVSAGVYYVPFTLTDPENTEWQVSEDGILKIPFEITKAENCWLDKPFISDTHVNSPLLPRATSKFGDVHYLYSTRKDSGFGEKIPEKPGDYFVKAKVYETDDYHGLESEAISFSILSEAVIELSVEEHPKNMSYLAFERFDPSGVRVKVIYDSGREEYVSGEKMAVTYQTDNCFRVGDNGVILSYGGVSIVLAVTVEKISYDLSAIDTEEILKIYNGNYQTYDKLIPDIVGKDGKKLEIRAIGGSTDVGSYEVILSFSGDSRDYVIPAPIKVPMTVLPLIVDIVWERLEFVYDSEPKVPMAYYTDVFGRKIYPKVFGAATEAGVDYKAFVTEDDVNYIFENAETTFKINKANYDFSKVFWEVDDFVYDGTFKSVKIFGLPRGVEVIGYTDDRAIDAGKYNATAAVRWDKNNYNAPPKLSCEWEIKKATYDVSSLKLIAAKCVYDGKIHYPKLEGALPIGKDGIPLEYFFDTGATHVSDGEVRSTLCFKTESKNYSLPSDMTSTVIILPRGIVAVWETDNIFYTGKKVFPSVSAIESTLTLGGGGVNVGKHECFAVADNTDYYVLNDTVEYEILKAKNVWVIEPQAGESFEGKEPNVSGELLFGEFKIEPFDDPECKAPSKMPLSPGKYYIKVYSEETNNYFAAESKVLEIDIKKIKPISLKITIKDDALRAFYILSNSDFSAFLINNDGSESEIDGKDVSVKYQNGDSLMRSDSFVVFSYLDFEKTVDVVVDFADYDLSGIKWENVTHSYDGKKKMPTLSGLPMGIELLGLSEGEMINAGVYVVFALVNYDEENYNKPDIPPCEFVIEKQIVPLPDISVIYDGNSHFPRCDSNIYTFTQKQGFINAGEHLFEVRLNDTENYRFEEDDDGVTNAVFRIIPKTVYVDVESPNIHLFEELDEITYSIIGAETVEERELPIRWYIDGDYLFLESEDPNFTLSFAPVKVNRLSYPSKGFVISSAIICGTILLFASLVIVLYLERNRVLSLVAIAKCKWHNRKMSVFPPKKNNYEENIAASYTPENNTEDKEHSDDEEGRSKRDEALTDDGQNAEFSFDEEIFGSESALVFKVDAERADALISDSLAKSLVSKEGAPIYTDGNEKSVISVGTINERFRENDIVDVNELKAKGIVSEDTAYVKVIEGGTVDKALHICANEFTLTAIKMIALSGGIASKCVTLKKEDKTDK